MAEPNPRRQVARVFAFVCYIAAGFVLLAGVLFTLAAATVSMQELQQAGGPMPHLLEGVTNLRMAIMMASMFVIIALMIVLVGWRVQRLFGQQHRQEKLVAKSSVGCLRLGSLGCGLWALPSLFTALITGTFLPGGEVVGPKEIFVGLSGFMLAIILMMAIAWFISANFLRLTLEEGRRAYHAYLSRVQPKLHGLADPAMRAYVQEQTMEVLTKLDPTLKRNLLDYLSESGVLSGDTRIVLHGVDFRRVDLRTISLPHADLRGTNLEEANLQGALLFEANLYKATLKKANLSRANLQGADLRQADLTDAVLDGTNLRGANLTGAIVTPTQLKQTRLERQIDGLAQ
jgi:hypothetical protein